MSEGFAQAKDGFRELEERVLLYFHGLTHYQQYAWIAIAAGLIFVIVALILW